MNKIKEIFNSYFWLIILALAVFMTVLGVSVYSDWRDGATNRTVNKQTVEANKAVLEAVNAQTSAISFGAERQTEDARRNATIKPKLGAARSKSKNSKNDFEKALKNYN